MALHLLLALITTTISNNLGTSWQGLNASALVMYETRSFSVVHGSTLNMPKTDRHRVQTTTLCRAGILDNCALGLHKLHPMPRTTREKCAILTGKPRIL